MFLNRKSIFEVMATKGELRATADSKAVSIYEKIPTQDDPMAADWIPAWQILLAILTRTMRIPNDEINFSGKVIRDTLLYGKVTL